MQTPDRGLASSSTAIAPPTKLLPRRPSALKDVPGAKLSLYDDTTRQIFILDPQDQAVGHLGDSVTVSGTVEGTTLHVASFKMLTDIGLAVGQKAPAFTARDQFGQRAKPRYAERTKGHRSSLFSFGRLVTVLQRAAGRAAKRESTI